jgi:hypothetical protein
MSEHIEPNAKDEEIRRLREELVKAMADAAALQKFAKANAEQIQDDHITGEYVVCLDCGARDDENGEDGIMHHAKDCLLVNDHPGSTLLAAFQFYADPANWQEREIEIDHFITKHLPSLVVADQGEMARKALGVKVNG